MISAIVPVYNAGGYIERCVASVQAQTMSDYELILVNDGSTDNSSFICHKLAEQDPRVKVVDIQNSGPAHARNVGIERACGEFLSFIDADDTVECNFFEKMYSVAKQERADIVMCRIRNVFINGNSRIAPMSVSTDTVLQGDQLRRELLAAFFVTGRIPGISSMCNKLIRSAWLKNTGITVDEKRVRAEDWLFNLQCILREPRFLVIEDALYNYISNSVSVMHTLREGEWWQTFDSMQMLMDINDEIEGNFQEEIALSSYLSIFDFALQLQKEGRANNLIELLCSEQLSKTMRMISLSKILRQTKAVAITGVLLKLRMPHMAKRFIGLL